MPSQALRETRVRSKGKSYQNWKSVLPVRTHMEEPLGSACYSHKTHLERSNAQVVWPKSPQFQGNGNRPPFVDLHCSNHAERHQLLFNFLSHISEQGKFVLCSRRKQASVLKPSPCLSKVALSLSSGPRGRSPPERWSESTSNQLASRC